MVLNMFVKRGAKLLTTAGVCSFLLVSTVMSALGASEWPIYRGNNSLTGVSDDVLPEKPVLLWSFKTEGQVKSSAVIGQNKVFIGSDDENIYALDFATGKKSWAVKTGGGVSSPPLLVGNTLVAGSEDGFVYALEAATGKELWKFQTGDKLVGSANYFTNKEGRLSILAGSYDFKLYCLDLLSGKTSWVYESSNFINGTPALFENMTAFGGCDAVLHVVSVVNGTRIQQCNIGAPIAASAALAGGKAYFGHYENEFVCVDLKQGKIDWKFHDRDLPYFSSPAVTTDRVLFGGNDKKLHCVNRADGKSVWEFATKGKVDGSPVVARGKVVVGSGDGRVYMISLKDGTQLWSYEIGRPISGSPAVAGGNIVIGSDDQSVYCFGKK